MLCFAVWMQCEYRNTPRLNVHIYVNLMIHTSRVYPFGLDMMKNDGVGRDEMTGGEQAKKDYKNHLLVAPTNREKSSNWMQPV